MATFGAFGQGAAALYINLDNVLHVSPTPDGHATNIKFVGGDEFMLGAHFDQVVQEINRLTGKSAYLTPKR